MLQSKPRVSIYHDTRSKLKSGLFPVKLHVTFRVDKAGKSRWIHKYYPCLWEDGQKICVSEKQFNSAMKTSSSAAEADRLRSRLKDFEQSARNELKKRDYVSVEIFERLFNGTKSTTSVLSLFDRYISELDAAGQAGTAAVYRTARNSFSEFGGDPVFMEVDQAWVKRYVARMKNKERYKMVVDLVDGKKVTKKVLVGRGVAVTTIAINLRCLRKIFNDAIKDHHTSPDYYPFGRRRFVIQEEQRHKKALSEDQKNAVLRYRTEDPEVRRSLDLWIFSYYCNGMNFSDLARLQYSDIQSKVIYFDRNKTINTVRVRKKIEIPMRDEVAQIISTHGVKSLDRDAYIFAVLDKGMTRKAERYRIQDFIDLVNQGLRVVADALEFDFKFTTYTARHTFATIAVQKGADKALIQEALGHQSIATTENYIAGFDIETKRKMSLKL